MNLNAVQTFLSALLVAIPAFLVGFGCTQDATGALDCSQSALSPLIVTLALAFISALKFVIIPAIQPGGWFRNLFQPKVPVSESGAVGTVTQGQVEQSAAVKKSA